MGNTSFLLASLGLPNTAMWQKLHYENCDELSEKIQQVGEKVINESLEKRNKTNNEKQIQLY